MRQASYQQLMWEGSDEAVAKLVERLADVNAPDQFGDHLLSCACKRLFANTVRQLVQRGADVDRRSQTQDTPLLCVIDHVHHNPSSARETATLLLDAGANIELRGYMDKTPFLKACSRGDLPMLRLLVERGCDIRARCSDVGGSLDGRQLAEIFNASEEFKSYLHGLYSRPNPSLQRTAKGGR